MVGTKYQAIDLIASVTIKIKKWLGGMLPNWSTIEKHLQSLKDLENK